METRVSTSRNFGVKPARTTLSIYYIRLPILPPQFHLPEVAMTSMMSRRKMERSVTTRRNDRSNGSTYLHVNKHEARSLGGRWLGQAPVKQCLIGICKGF